MMIDSINSRYPRPPLPMVARSGASRRRNASASNALALPSWSSTQQILKRTTIVAILLLLLFASVQGVNRLRAIEIGEISVQGYSGSAQSNRGITLAEIEALLSPYRNNPYWGVDLVAVQQALEAHPWVRSATIFREWPNRLRIGIDEQVPIARWNHGQLLAGSGDLIDVPGAMLFSSLPRFVAASSVQRETRAILEMVDHYNRFQRLLSSQYQSIVEVGVSDAGDLWLVLDSGARIELGKAGQLQRLQRLAGLVADGVIVDWGQIAEADLRYARGVSIRWSDVELDEELDSLIPLAALTAVGVTKYNHFCGRKLHG